MSADRSTCRNFVLPVLFAAAAVAALAVDLPIAERFKAWNAPSSTSHAYLGYLDMFEPFGHGLGLVLVILILHQLDPARRWAIPRLLACALAAGGAVDVLKMLVVRIRPHDFTFDGPVGATFGRWLPILSAESGGQSFPSAHTATAAALAAALLWLYPNGRLLFPTLAALVACQRVASSAHYPSDVLAGAAVGLLVAQFVLHCGRLPDWFERWETRWGRQSTTGE